MPDKLISVIIPCYNSANFIEACLQSVLAQTYPNIEVICVDDGSSDETVEVLEAFKNKNAPSMTILKLENGGAALARNKGLAIAKGQYIQFLDSDDILLPRKIEAQVDLIEEQGNAALIIGTSQYFDEQGNDLEVSEPYRENLWYALMIGNCGNTCANLFNAEAVKVIGGWDKALKASQEYDLMFRMFEHNPEAKVIYDEEVNTKICRRTSGSISLSNLSRNWALYTDLKIRIWKYVEEHKLSDKMDLFAQEAFDSIRTLYHYDAQKAIEYHKTYIPKSFVPMVSGATTGSYVKAYKLFGFKGAEKIKKLKGTISR